MFHSLCCALREKLEKWSTFNGGPLSDRDKTESLLRDDSWARRRGDHLLVATGRRAQFGLVGPRGRTKGRCFNKVDFVLKVTFECDIC